MAEDLRRLVYRSDTRISPDDAAELSGILSTSVQNNKRGGITGCLVLANGRFNQVLEGPAPMIALLMNNIKADARHENVNVLGQWPISARLFKGWAMAMPEATPLSDRSMRILSENGSGAQVTGILLTLADPLEKRHKTT